MEALEQVQLRIKLRILEQEHRDLDAAIAALESSGSSDQLQLRRLKKNKLYLKDQIQIVESQLIPDIIAWKCLALTNAVAIIMGSQSDWATMTFAADTLQALGVAFETRIISAHRTPDRLFAFAKGAKAAGFKVIIAGAGGAAHLPGMTAALTPLPVLGVPVESKALSGQDSLLSIVQMPAGIPVGTLAIGKPGAVNAAILAASILALHDDALAQRLDTFRSDQTAAVAAAPKDDA